MPRKKTGRNSFGSITKVAVVIAGRKVTRYDAKKRYTLPDGTRAQKFRRCRSDADAQTALLNFASEISHELANADRPQRHTFFQLCHYFEQEHIKPAVFVGDRQLGGYRQSLAALGTYVDSYRKFFGDVDVSRIGYEDIRRYAEMVATTPVSPGKGHKQASTRLPKPSTVNRKLAYLRRILNVGIQLGWIDRNPFGRGKRLIDANAEQPRERVLSFDEEERLLVACEGPRSHLRPAIIFAIESGLRKKELFSTTRAQVDFDRKVITLNARQTKALKRRVIPLSARLETELRGLFAKRILHQTDAIFGGAKDFDRAFATACRLAEIEGLHFHDLRHTAATWMDEAGISDAARRNAIGHGSVRVGQRYVNTSTDVLDASRVKMDEFRQKLEARKENGTA